MRADPSQLQSILDSDKTKARQQAYACQAQIDAVYDVVKSDSRTQGAAYDSARAYLSRVKLPALQCQFVFLDTLVGDLDSDIAALDAFGGETLDSEELEANISLYDGLIDRLYKQQQEQQSLQREQSAAGQSTDASQRSIESIEHLAQVYEGARAELQRKLKVLYDYTGNGSIYSASQGEASRLKEAGEALGQVAYDPQSHTYDLSNVSDGSWNSQDMQSKYWRSVINLILDNKDAPASVRKYVLNELKGTNDSALFGGDPVNLSTGNFIHQRVFLRMGGLFPLSFSLFYNSVDEGDATIGKGWSQNLGLHVLRHDSGMVSVRMADGHEALFFPEGGQYVGATVEGSLTPRAEGGWSYTDALATEFLFDAEGTLVRMVDVDGSGADLAYDESGLLERVVSVSGERLDFHHEGGLLVRVSDATGRSIGLEHEGALLVALTDELGHTRRYGYDHLGRMASLTNPRGEVTLRNAYDEHGRVARQAFANGAEITYRFDESGHELTLVDQEGHESSYESDGLYRTVAYTRPDGTERFEYDRRNLKTAHTSRLGHTTRFRYDRAGRVRSITNAAGQTLAFERNEMGRPLEVRLDGKMLVRNTFDGQGHLTVREDALGRAVRLSYDATGRPIRLTQPDGSVVVLTRDARGNVTRIEGDPGIRVDYAYDELGRVVARTNADGGVTRYEYDARGKVVRVTNAVGDSRHYRYDACGHMVEMRDYDGLSLKRSYDAFGLLRTATDKQGGTCTFEYDRLWRLARVTDPLGASTTYAYDRFGRLESVTDALGGSVRYEYDADDRCTQVTYQNGAQAHFDYDGLGRVIRVRDCSDAVTHLTYNRFGKVAQVVDPVGHRRTAEFDEVGQLVALTDELGARTLLDYDAMGHVSAITNPHGMRQAYEYLPGGLLARTRTMRGVTWSFAYDGCGRLKGLRQEEGASWSLTHDLLGRVTAVQGSEGWSRRYEYDALGRCSSLRDANGNLTRYVRDGLGRLVETIDALGGVTTFGYDARGDLVDVARSDGKGSSRRTHYERDLLGRVITSTDAVGNETSYAYDALGHPVRVMDADGYTTSYGYAPTGALREIGYADGRTVDFGYDTLGRLIDVEDWRGSTSIERDAVGRMVSVKDCSGSVVRYERGVAGELTGLVYPDGGRVGYEYDGQGRLTRLSARHGSVSYEYDHLSRLVRSCTSDGLETHYARDAVGRMTSMAHLDAIGEFMHLGLGYDAEGNKVRRSVRHRNLPEGDSELTYAYDALNRLVGVNRDGSPLRSYGYDAFGNRVWDEQLGEHTDYVYDAADRLLHVTRDGRATDFSYDGRGNLRVVSGGGHDERSYDYDATNRLVRATSQGDGTRTVRYAYDGLGQRIMRSLVDERDSEGAQTTRYVHDLSRVGRNLLQRSDDSGCESLVWNGAPVVAFSDSRTKWFACDELGSPLEALSADGGSVGAVGYDEFGQVTGGDPSALSGIGFAAYGLDPVAGTLFAEAREYDPLTGRFAARDRHAGMGGVPQTLNKYSYCWNSPLGYVDVNGLWPSLQDICDGVESATESVFEGAHEAWNSVAEPVKQVVSDKGTEVLNGLRAITEIDFKDVATAVAVATAPLSPVAAAGIYAAGNVPSTAFGVNDISDVATAFTQSSLGEQVLDFFSFSRDDGIYHAKQDCWQKPFGYNDFYDYMFKGLTSAPDKPPKYEFSVNGTSYTLWLWKGDYYNLGAGAESGIYRGDGFHKEAADDTNLYMKLNLYDKDGNVIFVYDPGQSNWWTTGFNPDVQDANQEDLIAYGSIDFSVNPEMWDAFYAKYSEQVGWCFDEERQVAYYAWQWS